MTSISSFVRRSLLMNLDNGRCCRLLTQQGTDFISQCSGCERRGGRGRVAYIHYDGSQQQQQQKQQRRQYHDYVGNYIDNNNNNNNNNNRIKRKTRIGSHLVPASHPVVVNGAIRPVRSIYTSSSLLSSGLIFNTTSVVASSSSSLSIRTTPKIVVLNGPKVLSSSSSSSSSNRILSWFHSSSSPFSLPSATTTTDCGSDVDGDGDGSSGVVMEDDSPSSSSSSSSSVSSEKSTSATEAAAGASAADDSSSDNETDIEYAFSPPAPLSDESLERVQNIFDKILWLDMIELHLLTQIVNEKMGVSWQDAEMGIMSGGAATAATAAGATSTTAATDVPEVKTIFDLKLVGFDAKAKIKVIKEIRAIAGLGLKEAKELVESAPKVFQKGLKQEKAEELKAVLESAGAEVEIV